jgi:hypothetical protein
MDFAVSAYIRDRRPPVRGGGGIPQRISRIVREYAGHQRQVADVLVHHAEQSNDGCLVRVML